MQLRDLNSELAKVIAFLIFGIFAWTIAALVFIIIGAALKLIFVCVVGIALGLAGLRYSIRRNNRGELN
jgi:energy-converting hydrogenase Eha subunit E